MREKELIGDAIVSGEELFNSVRKAHRVACDINPLLAVLLADVLKDIASIENRLEEIGDVLF
jgi:hypothetical protein